MRQSLRVAAVVLAVPLAAQSTPSVPASNEPFAETVVVTADRLEQPLADATDAITVIRREDLERSQAPLLLDALRDVAGLHVVQAGSRGQQTSVFLRGGSSAQTSVMIDGVALDNPFFGGIDIGKLATAGVERVEILRGPQSPLYGSNAMAGVINVITRRGGERAVDLRLEAGEQSSRRGELFYGDRSGALDWHLGGAYLETAGRYDNDELREAQATLGLRFTGARGDTLAASAHHNASDVGIAFNFGLPSPEREIAFDTSTAVLAWERQRGDWLDLVARVGLAQRDLAFRDPQDPYSRRSDDDSRSVEWTLQNSSRIGRHTLLYGVERLDERVDASADGATAVDQDLEQSSLYVQDKLFLDRTTIAIGARYDEHASFGGRFSPRLSLAHELGGGWRLRAAAGGAFRAPSAGELAYPFYGNPDLDPETSTSYEAGVDLEAARLAASLTAFRTDYDDLISFDPATFVAGNVARARTEGIELGATVRPAAGWRLQLAATWLDAIDRTTGEPLVRRPKRSGSLTVGYQQAVWGASLNVLAVGKRWEQDFETFAFRYNDAYTRIDLAGFYELRGGLRLTARVENLADEEYEEILGYVAPPRTVHGGLVWRFGGGA